MTKSYFDFTIRIHIISETYDLTSINLNDKKAVYDAPLEQVVKNMAHPKQHRITGLNFENVTVNEKDRAKQVAGQGAIFLGRKREYKANLGQFMTPPQIAKYMASLLTKGSFQNCSILDAGAGVGVLSSAVLDEWKTKNYIFTSTTVTAYEIDPSLEKPLKNSLAKYSNIKVAILTNDYIMHSVEVRTEQKYTHIILNPPYKKISSKSNHRLALRSVGIETGNLYSAFVALALRNLRVGGQLVAIIPRSFCNGPYFKPFRNFVLEKAAITHIHLFKSRTDAFKDDKVLQENIIIRLERGTKQDDVIVSTSTDGNFSDLISRRYSFEQIVQKSDVDKFIHIPTSQEKNIDEDISAIGTSLEDIEASVSTGPVVGFRLKSHLRDKCSVGCVPLVYPGHLKNGRVQWPLTDGKKANAIHQNDATNKWLYPNGFYCVVRRFSSKEERHRIVASVIHPEDFNGAKSLGLDNKLNVFHFKKRGISKNLAHGLAAFLNTDLVDEEFRLFSGHTQVNATDLRRIKYPKKGILEKLGEWVQEQQNPTQEEIYNFIGIQKV